MGLGSPVDGRHRSLPFLGPLNVSPVFAYLCTTNSGIPFFKLHRLYGALLGGRYCLLSPIFGSGMSIRGRARRGGHRIATKAGRHCVTTARRNPSRLGYRSRPRRRSTAASISCRRTSIRPTGRRMRKNGSSNMRASARSPAIRAISSSGTRRFFTGAAGPRREPRNRASAWRSSCSGRMCPPSTAL